MTLRRIIITLLLLCILIGNSVAQSPFDYGKTKNIYFISTKEIQKHKIDHIYTITASPEYGKWDFFDIDFTDISHRFYNKWCQGRDDSSNIPRLDSLILEAEEGGNYVNASFYSFENNRIEQAGMAGMGALCYSNYTFYKGYSIADESCKYANKGTQKKIVYFPNGRVNYTVCCKISDLENRIIGRRKDVFKDTTYYSYNSKRKVLGYKNKKQLAKFTPIFSKMVRQHTDIIIQTFINQTTFESYIDQMIGYRPKLLLFEIYQNAVLPFHYDSKQKKYIEMLDIHLE